MQKQSSRTIRRVSGLVIIILTRDMLVERQPRPSACGCEVTISLLKYKVNFVVPKKSRRRCYTVNWYPKVFCGSGGGHWPANFKYSAESISDYTLFIASQPNHGDRTLPYIAYISSCTYDLHRHTKHIEKHTGIKLQVIDHNHSDCVGLLSNLS